MNWQLLLPWHHGKQNAYNLVNIGDIAVQEGYNVHIATRSLLAAVLKFFLTVTRAMVFHQAAALSAHDASNML